MKQKNYSILVLLLIYFVIAMFPFASAALDQTAAVSKTTVIGTELAFKPNELLARVSDRTNLDGIMICDLPSPKVGVLKFGNRDMLCGEAVTIENLDAFRFVPVSPSEARTTFQFVPVYKSGETRAPIRVNINLLASKNGAPVCQNIALKTARNIAVSGVFQATDPEKEAVTFRVVDAPKLGEVTLCADSPNKFIYTPYQSKTGTDQFTYIAADKHGNTSAPGTVTVKIERAKVQLTYADMTRNGAHYAAIQLAQRNIFRGETIGSINFFHPERAVSRSEFIAMVVSAFDIDCAAKVANCGFPDDKLTPAWAKSFVAGAKEAGLINGGLSGKQTVLRPNAAITRGEAAVILNNAIRLSNPAAAPTFHDLSTVPAWALKATQNVYQYNILHAFADGTIRTNAPLSRAGAAEILYKAICVHDDLKKK